MDAQVKPARVTRRVLWRTVLRRQGGWLASLSSYPDDPSVN